MIDELREEHHFTNAKIEQPQSWYTFSTGISTGLQFGGSFVSGGSLRAEIYIDFGDAAANEAAFALLESRKDKIENALGTKLSWEPLENARASRIAIYLEGADIVSGDHEKYRAWLIGKLLQFKKLLGKHLKDAAEAASEAQE